MRQCAFLHRECRAALRSAAWLLPLRCLCVIITTCSMPFLLSYIYIPFFLLSFCALGYVIQGLGVFFLEEGVRLCQSGVDRGKQKCYRDLKGCLGGKVPQRRALQHSGAASVTQLWLRFRLPIDQCTAGLTTAGRGQDSFTPPLQKIIFSIIHFL